MAHIGLIDSQTLRRQLRLGEDDEIPARVVDKYLNFKWFKDTTDASPLTGGEAAFVCCLAGINARQGALPELDPDNPIPELAIGTPVNVLWRRGKKAAIYRGAAKVRPTVMVQFDDEPEFKEIEPERILGVLQEA